MSRHAFRRPGLLELRVNFREDLVCVSIVDVAHKAGELVFATSPVAGIRLAPDDRAHPTGRWHLWMSSDTVFTLSLDEAIALAASGVITPTHALPTAVAA